MIVYCALPIRGDQSYTNYHKEIIEHIKSLGHTPLSELNTEFKPAVMLTPKEIFSRDIKWIDRSSTLIAEVSGHSTGVGFEIAYALYKRKIPVLALANESSDNASAMITGCNSDLLTIKNYGGSSELKNIISSFLDKNNPRSSD